MVNAPFQSFNGLIGHYIRTGIIKGSSEVKLQTIWTDGKAKMGRATEEKSEIGEKSEERRSIYN